MSKPNVVAFPNARRQEEKPFYAMVGARLRAARLEKELRLIDVAAMTSIPYNTISTLELGKRTTKISLLDAYKLATEYTISMDALCHQQPVALPVTQELHDAASPMAEHRAHLLWRAYANLPEAARDMVASLAMELEMVLGTMPKPGEA